jgi:prevent-host-death family protein
MRDPRTAIIGNSIVAVWEQGRRACLNQEKAPAGPGQEELLHSAWHFRGLALDIDWSYIMTSHILCPEDDMAARTIGAAEFKAQCLALLDSVEPEGIVITKHGKPVARLLPIVSESAELMGILAGQLKINGKILSTNVAWDAES